VNDDHVLIVPTETVDALLMAYEWPRERAEGVAAQVMSALYRIAPNEMREIGRRCLEAEERRKA
jgi:hypothetical protein